MQGDVLSSVVLPLGLAFIMFTLGAGLQLADFRRVFQQPRAFAVGVLCHFVILPLIAYLVLTAFGLEGALAVGVMIIAACPTGTTSNLLTYHARADVALALSFTAVAGFAAIITVPAIVGWAMTRYLGQSPDFRFPYGMVMGQIFMVLGLPVALGMLMRNRLPAFTQAWHARFTLISTVLFAVIVIAAFAKNWAIVKEHGPALAPLVLSINVVMLLLGFGLSKLARVPLRQAATVGIESSVQNGTLAVVIGSSILMNDAMAVPGAVYSILMYVTGIVFVLIVRRFVPPATAEQLAADRAAMH